MAEAPRDDASAAEAEHAGRRGERAALTARRGWLSADTIVAGLSRTAAVIILLMLASLLVVLTYAAWPSIVENGLSFITETTWRPNTLTENIRDEQGRILYNEDGTPQTREIPPEYGALPVIYGTAMSSLIALIIAVPISFGTALFLVRLCPNWLSKPVSFLVEFLAAIPSIAYGLWGMFILAPFLGETFEPFLRDTLGQLPFFSQWLFYDGDVPVRLTGLDLFCGGLVLAIMILPIITAISRDVLHTVPRSQIEGTLALGATWWQSSKEMLRYSRAGLFGAVMLGLGRAAGETMAVTMVIGNQTEIHASPFKPAQTMSSLLATQFAEAPAGSMQLAALTEVALILLVMSLAFNIVARWIVVGKDSRSAAAT